MLSLDRIAKVFATIMLVIFIVAYATAGWITGAHADQRCNTLEKVDAYLDTEWSEVVVEEFVSIEGKFFIRIYANPVTQTYTIVKILTTGVACMVGAGAGWNDIGTGPIGPDQPA